MIPPTLIRITFPLFVSTISLPSSCVSFLFHSALSLIQYLAFVSINNGKWELTSISIWSFVTST